MFFLCSCSFLFSQSANIELISTYSGFNSPVDLTHAGDGSDRIFIVERSGTIRIIDDTGTTLSTPFLTVSGVSSGGERGLLGLAFHPDYETNGYFFVNYTDSSGGDTRIARYNVSASNPNVADASSGVVLLEIDQPFGNHNAGDLNFGPDGYLYIAMGDGGSSGDPQCFAQNPTSLLGKVLRLDVDQNINTAPYFGIPTDNPFVGNPSVDDRIWAIGLRNPWRCSFDRITGDYWIGDVGQNAWEEVNKQDVSSPGGENYGWKVMEGDHCFDFDPIDTDCPAGTPSCFDASYTGPVFEYNHSFATGGLSLTGGYVYRGCKYPLLYGYYICADFVSDNVWQISSNGTLENMFSAIGDDISTFGEDEDGELYAVSLNGTVYQVTDSVMETDCTCPLDTLINGIITAGVYNYENSIISDGVVETGSDVVFNAGNTIELQNNFEVEDGASFLAQILDCNSFNSFMNNVNTRLLLKDYIEYYQKKYIFDPTVHKNRK